jgi:peptidyl-prolyl cis-trans isomerase B (cyclophilin B)
MSTFYSSGDQQGYENYIISLKPMVEQQLGIKLDKEVSPEYVKTYTTIGGAPHLDGQYTVFGKVISGLGVIDKIAAQPKDQANRPLQDIRMMVTVEELPVKKIEKLYGYTYPGVKK